MKTTYATGYFSEGIDPVVQQKIENAYLRAKPKVIETFRQHYGKDAIVDGSACLYWAVFGCEALEEAGFKPMLQAGSMFWTTSQTPLPNQVNRIGFEFNYGALAAQALMNGGMPELHVWLAVPDQQLLIDFSTEGLMGMYRDLREAAREADMLERVAEWDAEESPKYFAAVAGEDIETYPHQCHYSADPLAILLAIKSARDLLIKRGVLESPEGLKVPAKIEPMIQKSLGLFMQRCEDKRAADENRDPLKVVVIE